MMNLSEISYDDSKVWNLLGSGLTKGIFQMESKLMRHWVKKIKPKNMYELAAVTAIVRPGVLNTGQADQYVAYKDGTKEFKSFGHEIIDNIFKDTHHVLLYQESLMALGTKLAWPQLPEKDRLIKVDALRKGVGKKDQAKLVAICNEFAEACIQNGVDKQVVDRLVEIIKASGRYLFNASHAMAYAYLAYQTAYLKVYYPLQFLSTYLTYSKFKSLHKWEEIYELVQEARILGIEILPPNINKKNHGFAIEDDKIRYGLGTIKYFGGNTIDLVRALPRIDTWQQLVLLCNTDTFGEKLRSTTAEALILVGAFSDCSLPRKVLYNIYKFFDTLTTREITYITERFAAATLADLPALVEQCAQEVSNVRRRQTVLSELKMLKLDEWDHPSFVEQCEMDYLGIYLTASASDSAEKYVDICRDCSGDVPDGMAKYLTAVIDEIKFTTTKKGKSPGQKMAIIRVHDSSGELDKLPIFPSVYDNCCEHLIEKNIVYLSLFRKNNNWIINGLTSTK